MGTVNWVAVILAGLVAGAVLAVLGKGRKPLWLLLNWVPAAMLGHALARIGADKLAAKPQLYFMQSGGLALAFVIPALWLSQSRHGVSHGETMKDSAAFLCAYLAMGAVFWGLG